MLEPAEVLGKTLPTVLVHKNFLKILWVYFRSSPLFALKCSFIVCVHLNVLWPLTSELLNLIRRPLPAPSGGAARPRLLLVLWSCCIGKALNLSASGGLVGLRGDAADHQGGYGNGNSSTVGNLVTIYEINV